VVVAVTTDAVVVKEEVAADQETAGVNQFSKEYR